MSDNTIKLGDDSIGIIARALQVAILSGTDVVDNLRIIRFELDDLNFLHPTDEYLSEFDKSVETMMEEAVASLNPDNFVDEGVDQNDEVDVEDW